MMRKATGYHVLRTAILLVFLTLCAWGTWHEYSTLRADALVRALASAETTDVPKLVAEIKPYRRWADPLLAQMAEEAPEESKERLHAGLALVRDDRAKWSS